MSNAHPSEEDDFPGFRECPCCEGHGQLSAESMRGYRYMERLAEADGKQRDALMRIATECPWSQWASIAREALKP